MTDAAATNVTLVEVSHWPTRNGKQRWKARTTDGRELGIWDQNLANVAGAHLHEDLLAEITSKQDGNGNWWMTLQSLPALGVSAAPQGQQQGGQQVGSAAQTIDLSPLVTEVAAIRLSLENALAFVIDAFLKGRDVSGIDATDDGPQEP